jgi:methionyl-tRNA formyltransferase
MIKVLIVTQNDPFYIPYFFQEFVKILPKDVQVAGIVIQRPLGKKSLISLFKRMWNFYGPRNFIRVGFKFVYIKLFGKIIPRSYFKKMLGVYSLENILHAKKWEKVDIQDINSIVSKNILSAMNLDLIVSIAASQKFRREILNLPRYGCINVHVAKLPKNRGMMPNFWSLYNYDKERMSAVTVHKMNDELDDGPIILQEEFVLNEKESLHTLMKKSKVLSAHLVARALLLYRNGEPKYIHNDASLATYNSFPTKADVRSFNSKGLKLL